jgi:hypothetical protein
MCPAYPKNVATRTGNFAELTAHHASFDRQTQRGVRFTAIPATERPIMRIDSSRQSLVRNVLLLALLSVFLSSALAAAQEPPKTLIITSIDRIPLDGPGHSEDAESLFYMVNTEYPQDWQEEVENTFKVMVNGNAANYEGGGGSFGSGTAGADFWVYLGTPGTKKVEVTLVKDGKTIRAEKEFIVPAVAALRLLGHYNGECLLQNEALELISYSVKDAVVKVNGKQVQPGLQPLQGLDGISTITIPPSLTPGKNVVEFSGTDPDGKRVSHAVALYFVADHKMKVGDRCLFTYGGVRSKSGPFYYVNPDGNMLALEGGNQWKTILIQKPDGWVHSDEVFGWPIAAKKAGIGGLALFVKSNFMLPEELDKKIQFTVEP